MALTLRNCGNCRFFDDRTKYTHCRRFPPQPGQGNSMYPLIPWFAAGCGEHRVHLLRFVKNLGRKMELPPQAPTDVPSKEG